MSKWSDYYQGRVGPEYASYVADKYKPFIDEVFIGKGAQYHEEGCGIGTVSRILREMGAARLTAMDNCPHMLRLCSENVPDMSAWFDNILTVTPSPGWAEVIHSHRVLEHFSDQQIEIILARQKYQASKRVVHYVPTNEYPEPSFGCERLLPWTWWVDRWKPTRFSTFNNRKDLVLVWEVGE